MQNLAELATAIAIAHGLHSLGEATNVNKKITRLADAVAGKTLKPYPANIDTRTKAYSIGIGIFVILSSLFYLVLNVLSFDINALLTLIIVLIAVVDISGTMSFDKYHISIEKLINKFDKKGTK